MEDLTKQIIQENVSQRKLETYENYAEIVQAVRRNPIWGCETLLGIKLMDFQKWLFMNMWNAKFILLVMSRNAGKSTLIAPYTMLRGMVFPSTQAYIMSLTGSQSQDTFLKIENITKNNIPSFTSLTSVFSGEVVSNVSNKDGFTHGQSGYKYALYNGSQTISLPGNEDNLRGKRSNLNIYDESGFIKKSLIDVTMPFIAQDSAFALGNGEINSCEPIPMPNQAIFLSSASSEDSAFYELYREYSMQMLAGNKDYFVASLDCDVVMGATVDGVKLLKPLLSQATVDNAMQTNRPKALREYYNIFDTEGAAGAPIKRASIIRNQYSYLPSVCNDTNSQRRFIHGYDGARYNDNSAFLTGELIDNEEIGLKLRVVNCVSFLDVMTKRKMQMRVPEQIQAIQEYLVDYNGTGFAQHENLEKLLIDPAHVGISIGDELMAGWVSKDGKRIKGIIDFEAQEEYIRRFPDAVDKLRLVGNKYRNDMYDALVECIDNDLIEFPESYDMKGFVMIPKETKDGEIEYEKYNLSFEEEMALIQIDLLKEELVRIVRTESASKSKSYHIERMIGNHGDRAVCLAMMCWHLKNLRREHITKKQKSKNGLDISKLMVMKKANVLNRK